MIIPVLLCGGSGTRLWPLSRQSYPKQFSNVVGEVSLFQASAQRFWGEGFEAPVIVTGDDFRFIVLDQLNEIGVKPASILIEPEGRNTAPAAILATLSAAKSNPEAMVLLVPSDHAVSDPQAFRQAVNCGAVAASEGRIVTFGITPTRAETGYGWLELGLPSHDGVNELNRYVEKPNAQTAETLFKDDRYLWNSGVFLAKVSVLIDAYRKYAPEILAGVEASFEAARDDLSFTRVDTAFWNAVPENSIDYAVMERAENISVVRFIGDWSDLGSWESVWKEMTKDEMGNALHGLSTALQCEDTLLRSESEEVELVGIGLKNVVAVAMRDAVMVADLSDSQNVKEAVKVLKNRKAKQAISFPVEHRPWGWYESLILSDRFQVKRIHVHPGAALSLQSHMHRSEHWIVVQGTARVMVDDEVKLLTENQSIYIPLGAVHRMENPGKVPMVLIEVQTGSYLGEDDIVRYEDVYARS